MAMNPDTALWRFFHALFFLTGGFTFIVGTAALYYPDADNDAALSAWFYIVGSAGFLAVDVTEFFTFTEDKWLRFNISLSMFGSLCYLIGSIGFLPAVFNNTEAVGVWGFIVGSFFIACSQTWKIYRIGCTASSVSVQHSDAGYGKLIDQTHNAEYNFVSSPSSSSSSSSSSFQIRNLFADASQFTAARVNPVDPSAHKSKTCLYKSASSGSA